MDKEFFALSSTYMVESDKSYVLAFGHTIGTFLTYVSSLIEDTPEFVILDEEHLFYTTMLCFDEVKESLIKLSDKGICTYDVIDGDYHVVLNHNALKEIRKDFFGLTFKGEDIESYIRKWAI